MIANHFVNKQVINSNNEIGIVTYIDESHVSVKYDQCEKCYKTEIAFKNGFLNFVNNELNSEMKDHINHVQTKEEEKQKLIKQNNEAYKLRREKVNNLYKIMKRKNHVMKQLFGRDFVYPPYKDFEKKYKYLIEDRNKLLNDIYRYCKITPWYYHF